MLPVILILLLLIIVAIIFTIWRLQTVGTCLDAIQSRFEMLDEIAKQSGESRIHAQETKAAVHAAVTDVATLRNQASALSEAQSRLSVALESFQGSLKLNLNEGIQRLASDVADAHATFRKDAEERGEAQARTLTSRIDTGLQGMQGALSQLRTELNNLLKGGHETLAATVGEMRITNDMQLQTAVDRSAEGAKTLNDSALVVVNTLNDRFGDLKAAIDAALKSELGAIRTENSAKLEEMRMTVDEKLHATLEQRLGESFKLVSDRLEQVHRGLGEMQALATGVGDLRKVLMNVKTRGTWGEVQLETLLDQVLTIDQYSKNVATKPGSLARVEFAIRLPGRDESGSVWLPIDAKFPLEDYQRLVDSQEKVDLPMVEEAGRALETRIKAEARSIREKYIEPPHTTDFAILYLPTEGLYAEVLRRPGLADLIQRDFRILLCGPTNLAALLNSLQMGFRTLAIEKRSSEVWNVLAAVKTEFGKFGEALAHTKRKLDEASNSIDSAARRNRVLTRKLSGVDELPAPEATRLLESVVPAVGASMSEELE